jgi:ABC-type dipeptide/oligopeptide/nickel transport system ATPase subunit
MALLDDILQWSQKSLKLWQQDAVRRIFQQTLDVGAIDDLYAMLKDGAGLADPQGRKPSPLAKQHLPVLATKAKAVTLLSMSKLANVNRLAPEQTLKFSAQGMTVVYGGNGAGKSGYARVLKRACRSRDSSEVVRPNALLKPSAQGVPACSFEVEIAGNQSVVGWSGGKISPSELATIAVFDSHCARAFLDQDQEIAYLPFGLDVVETLAQVVIPKVSERLSAELLSVSTSKDAFAHLLGPTKVGSLIAALSSATLSAEVEKLAGLNDEELVAADSVEKTLGESDPSAKAKSLRLAAQRFADVCKTIDASTAWVKDEAIAKLAQMDSEAEAATTAASVAAAALRSGEALLAGTGDEVWRALFDAARQFSVDVAYVEKAFPHVHDDAHCVLCQQPLSSDAGERLKRFEDFVQANVAKSAAEKRQARQAALVKIESANVAIEIAEAVQEELKSTDPDLLPAIAAFGVAVEARRAWMLASLQSHGWTGAPEHSADPRPRLNVLREGFIEQAVQYEKVMIGKERTALEMQAAEFRARKALGLQKQAVLDLLERLRTKALLTKCKEDLNTKAISDKAKEFASSTVTEPLRVALKEEFDSLGVVLATPRLNERVKKGKLSHKLELELQSVAEIRDILSEGEQRAIAIGSFLAELRIAGHAGGIVFDDPVSSLDHFRRQKVARRLVKEAKHRQVIVFTHDTVFLAELQELLNDGGVQNLIHYLEWRGEYAGAISAGLPWAHQTFKERIDKLQQAQSTLSKNPWPAYPDEVQVTEIRSNYNRLRATVEKFIQDVIFNGVVMRYRDWIKVGNLAEVVGFDALECLEIERLHKKCCDIVDAHDPASGKNAPVPTPAELGGDIAALVSLANAVKVRRAGQKKAATVQAPSP